MSWRKEENSGFKCSLVLIVVALNSLTYVLYHVLVTPIIIQKEVFHEKGKMLLLLALMNGKMCGHELVICAHIMCIIDATKRLPLLYRRPWSI